MDYPVLKSNYRMTEKPTPTRPHSDIAFHSRADREPQDDPLQVLQEPADEAVLGVAGVSVGEGVLQADDPRG